MASIPNPPISLAPPIDAATTKPPWRPLVSGVAGFLCGPLAGALVTFINLRRLNKPAKAAWTLALTILATIILGIVIAKASDSLSTGLSRVVGSFISPFLYPFLQKSEFDDWQKTHPAATPDKGARSIGWAILGLLVFMGLAIGAAVAISQNDKLENITVRYGVPAAVKTGDDFQFTISVENTSDKPQLLYSLDFDTHFLDAVSIPSTTPPFKESKPNPLAPIRSFIYEQTIPAKSALEIHLTGHAQKAGTFPLAPDVCVKTALACANFTLKPVVVQ